MLKPVVALTLAFSLALSGCASQSRFESSSNNSNLTQDQRTLRANAARVDPEAGSDTTAEGMLIGGLVLGAIGCGLALALGGDGAACAAGAGAGIVVGAAGGYIAGSWLAGEQRSYASREAHLESVSESAELEVEANQQAAAAARRVTDYHRNRLADLQAKNAAKKITRARPSPGECGDEYHLLDGGAVAVQSIRQRMAAIRKKI